MKRGWIIGIAATTLASTAASAQEAYHWPAPMSAEQSARMTEFAMGTPLALVTRTEVNTKQAKPGDRVYLEVAESLSYRGQIVVPVGSPAVAEVARSERNGHFGKRGTIELRLLYAQTPSGSVRLTGSTASQGHGATAWSVTGAALVAWPLVFWHGTSGYIRQGTAVNGYLAEPLLFAAQAPQVAPAIASVQPDNARSLPARFDPSVFAGKGPGFASR